MSHELRTPLNAILGFAQLLEMDGLEHKVQVRTRALESARLEMLGRLALADEYRD